MNVAADPALFAFIHDSPSNLGREIDLTEGNHRTRKIDIEGRDPLKSPYGIDANDWHPGKDDARVGSILVDLFRFLSP